MALSTKRKGRLTASNFAAAMGLNPYMSRQKLFRQFEGLEPRFEGNDMTEYGNLHESDAVDAYEAISGDILSNAGDDQKFIIHPKHDWLGCTPDGFVSDTHIVEFKCPYSQKLYELVPAYYMPQIQGQMAIIGADACDFVCWTPFEIAVWKVYFNEEYWGKELGLLDKFYKSWKSGEEPKRAKKPIMPEIKAERIVYAIGE